MKEPEVAPFPKTEAAQSPEQLQGKIRQRAYELYELRGGEDGHDLEDWLQAESELTGTGET